MQGSRHFKVIVAGENPEEIISKYDSNLKVAPYRVFEFKKAGEYKKDYIKSLKAILKNAGKDITDEKADYLKEMVKETEEQSDTDYYLDLTDGLVLDEKTGDAMSTENPNGKFSFHKIGGSFSVPFILKEKSEIGEDRETYSARKGDIDWDRIHLANTRAYEVAWDTTHGLATPQDDEERTIYENMKGLTAYFANFDDREHYIASNTAFWGLAFVDENGWNELDDSNTRQFDWVVNFYNTFIKPLTEDTLLTIYECVRPI